MGILRPTRRRVKTAARRCLVAAVGRSGGSVAARVGGGRRAGVQGRAASGGPRAFRGVDQRWPTGQAAVQDGRRLGQRVSRGVGRRRGGSQEGRRGGDGQGRGGGSVAGGTCRPPLRNEDKSDKKEATGWAKLGQNWVISGGFSFFLEILGGQQPTLPTLWVRPWLRVYAKRPISAGGGVKTLVAGKG